MTVDIYLGVKHLLAFPSKYKKKNSQNTEKPENQCKFVHLCCIPTAQSGFKIFI